MTQRLSAESPRYAYAQQIGALIERRMRELEVGQNVLKNASGVSRASIVEMRHGRNLPTLEVALRLAEALGEPRIVELARKGRTIECRRCSRPFVNEAGLPKRYCSEACRRLGGVKDPDETERGVMLLRGELLRVGPPRKQVIGKALTLLDDALQPGRATLHGLEAYQDAVSAMCGDCEPDGLCRTAGCALRGVSPLPLATNNDVEVRQATKAPGMWGTPGMREHMAESMRQQWAANPERRARALEVFRQPETRQKAIERSVAASKARSFEDRSAASKKAWETRRARRSAA